MGITLNKLYPGKLEHDFLGTLIDKYTTGGNRIVQGAKVGEDATVIDMGERYLVVKTDPITFATDHIGYYAVHVNINDIVCMGAAPKWFLATILLPRRATRRMAEDIFAQIYKICKKEKIAYCGGHTEVTIGLDRPIVVGQMLGEVDRDKLLLKQNAGIGDHIIVVQGAPVEGTSVLAREKAEALGQEFSADFVKKCQNLLFDPGISVRRYAFGAAQTAEVHAMHDPTEGGIATAVHELALAVNAGVRIDKGKIPLLAEGKLVCDFFDIDPLGCISSGSLLLAVPYKSVAPILKKFEKSGIPAADIGKLTEASEGMVLVDKGKERRLPVFAQDEIARVL